MSVSVAIVYIVALLMIVACVAFTVRFKALWESNKLDEQSSVTFGIDTVERRESGKFAFDSLEVDALDD